MVSGTETALSGFPGSARQEEEDRDRHEAGEDPDKADRRSREEIDKDDRREPEGQAGNQCRGEAFLHAIPSVSDPEHAQRNTGRNDWEEEGDRAAEYLASKSKTAAGIVIGTARSEKEVSGSYPRQGRATAAIGEKPSASMIGGSIVTGVAPIETRNDPNPTFRIMICSYRSAAMDLMYAVIRAIAPVTSIIVTCRIVKRTISEMPNDESTPLQDAYSAMSGEVEEQDRQDDGQQPADNAHERSRLLQKHKSDKDQENGQDCKNKLNNEIHFDLPSGNQKYLCHAMA